MLNLEKNVFVFEEFVIVCLLLFSYLSPSFVFLQRFFVYFWSALILFHQSMKLNAFLFGVIKHFVVHFISNEVYVNIL